MFPARHRGSVTRRAWYKVKWSDDEGRETMGLLPEELYAREREHVDVLDVIETDRCVAGPPLTGWTEARINAWMKANRK